MLSDSLFQAHFMLCRDIHHYSKAPWNRSYPDAQKSTIVASLAYLDMARNAYDTIAPDNKKYSRMEIAFYLAKALSTYNDAILGIYNGDPIE